MASPFEVYIDYLALKRHFQNPNYDYIKYNGRVSATRQSFDKRKDRFFFEKVSKHHDPHSFLVANIAHNPKVWIKEIAYSDNAQAVYLEWSKRQESITRFFQQQLNKLNPNLPANFSCTNGHPLLLRLFLSNEISLETLIIVLRLAPKGQEMWDTQLKDDPIWNDVKQRIIKYSPFVKFDIKKIKPVAMDYFQN